jgi:hypothetical protein
MSSPYFVLKTWLSGFGVPDDAPVSLPLRSAAPEDIVFPPNCKAVSWLYDDETPATMSMELLGTCTGDAARRVLKMIFERGERMGYHNISINLSRVVSIDAVLVTGEVELAMATDRLLEVELLCGNRKSQIRRAHFIMAPAALAQKVLRELKPAPTFV